MWDTFRQSRTTQGQPKQKEERQSFPQPTLCSGEIPILSHRGEFLKPPQSAHSADARVTCKESASLSVSRRFLKTARYACQSGDSQESRYREEASQKSERFSRKQKLYLVSEECCSMRRLLKPSESRVRATLSTCQKSSKENRDWGSEKCCSIRRPLRCSESHG